MGLLESIGRVMPGVGFILGGVIAQLLESARQLRGRGRGRADRAGGRHAAAAAGGMDRRRAPRPTRRLRARPPSRPTSEPNRQPERRCVNSPSTAAMAAVMVGRWEASRSDHRSGCCHGRWAAFPRWAQGAPGLPSMLAVARPGGASCRRSCSWRLPRSGTARRCSSCCCSSASTLRRRRARARHHIARRELRRGAAGRGADRAAGRGLMFAAPELTRLANDRRLMSMLANLASFGWASLAAAWTLQALGHGVARRAGLGRTLRGGCDRRPRADPRQLLLHDRHHGPGQDRHRPLDADPPRADPDHAGGRSR